MTRLPLLVPALFLIIFALAGSIREAPSPGLDVFSTPAMAQGNAHKLLLDVHTAANVTCAACHGDGQPTAQVAATTCTNCHGSYQDIAALTPWEPNPHLSHMGEVQCTTCHKVHKASESFCDKCHSFGMVVP